MGCNCNKNKKELDTIDELRQLEIENHVSKLFASSEYKLEDNVTSSTGQASCGFTLKIDPVFNKKSKIEVKVKCEGEVYERDIRVSYWKKEAGRPSTSGGGIHNYQPPSQKCPSGCAYNSSTRCRRVSNQVVAKERGIKKKFSILETVVTEVGPQEGGKIVVTSDSCGSCDNRSTYKACFPPNCISMSNCKSGQQLCQEEKDKEMGWRGALQQILDKTQTEHANKIADAKKTLEDQVKKAIDKANSEAKIVSSRKPTASEITNHVTGPLGGCSQGMNINWQGQWQMAMKPPESCDGSSMDKFDVKATIGKTDLKGNSGFVSNCPKDSCQSNADCSSASNAASIGYSNLKDVLL